ncbi:MAG: hypothetical protein GY847_14745 [Proteobacteria bacterium]|nr:hypothetical protein [Pseudomonadota bacterium]
MLFDLFYRAFPFADRLRYPAKFVALSTLSIPMLAAFGLDRWDDMADSEHQKRRLSVFIACLIFAVVLGMAALLSPVLGSLFNHWDTLIPLQTATETFRAALYREAAVFVFLGCALLLVWRRSPRRFGLAMVCAILVQLFSGNWDAAPTTALAIYDTPLMATAVRNQTPANEPSRQG